MPASIILAAATGLLFNLSCNLESKIQVNLREKPAIGHYREVLRIDLMSNRWCDDDCHETRPIASVTERELILISDADPQIDAYESLIINRESGGYVHHDRINESSVDEKGTCQPTKFRGFPTLKF